MEIHRRVRWILRGSLDFPESKGNFRDPGHLFLKVTNRPFKGRYIGICPKSSVTFSFKAP